MRTQVRTGAWGFGAVRSAIGLRAEARPSGPSLQRQSSQNLQLSGPGNPAG